MVLDKGITKGFVWLAVLIAASFTIPVVYIATQLHSKAPKNPSATVVTDTDDMYYFYSESRLPSGAYYNPYGLNNRITFHVETQHIDPLDIPELTIEDFSVNSGDEDLNDWFFDHYILAHNLVDDEYTFIPKQNVDADNDHLVINTDSAYTLSCDVLIPNILDLEKNPVYIQHTFNIKAGYYPISGNESGFLVDLENENGTIWQHNSDTYSFVSTPNGGEIDGIDEQKIKVTLDISNMDLSSVEGGSQGLYFEWGNGSNQLNTATNWTTNFSDTQSKWLQYISVTRQPVNSLNDFRVAWEITNSNPLACSKLINTAVTLDFHIWYKPTYSDISIDLFKMQNNYTQQSYPKIEFKPVVSLEWSTPASTNKKMIDLNVDDDYTKVTLTINNYTLADTSKIEASLANDFGGLLILTAPSSVEWTSTGSQIVGDYTISYDASKRENLENQRDIEMTFQAVYTSFTADDTRSNLIQPSGYKVNPYVSINLINKNLGSIGWNDDTSTSTVCDTNFAYPGASGTLRNVVVEYARYVDGSNEPTWTTSISSLFGGMLQSTVNDVNLPTLLSVSWNRVPYYDSAYFDGNDYLLVRIAATDLMDQKIVSETREISLHFKIYVDNVSLSKSNIYVAGEDDASVVSMDLHGPDDWISGNEYGYTTSYAYIDGTEIEKPEAIIEDLQLNGTTYSLTVYLNSEKPDWGNVLKTVVITITPWYDDGNEHTLDHLTVNVIKDPTLTLDKVDTDVTTLNYDTWATTSVKKSVNLNLNVNNANADVDTTSGFSWKYSNNLSNDESIKNAVPSFLKMSKVNSTYNTTTNTYDNKWNLSFENDPFVASSLNDPILNAWNALTPGNYLSAASYDGFSLTLKGVYTYSPDGSEVKTIETDKSITLYITRTSYFDLAIKANCVTAIANSPEEGSGAQTFTTISFGPNTRGKQAEITGWEVEAYGWNGTSLTDGWSKVGDGTDSSDNYIKVSPTSTEGEFTVSWTNKLVTLPVNKQFPTRITPTSTTYPSSFGSLTGISLIPNQTKSLKDVLLDNTFKPIFGDNQTYTLTEPVTTMPTAKAMAQAMYNKVSLLGCGSTSTKGLNTSVANYFEVSSTPTKVSIASYNQALQDYTTTYEYEYSIQSTIADTDGLRNFEGHGDTGVLLNPDTHIKVRFTTPISYLADVFGANSVPTTINLGSNFLPTNPPLFNDVKLYFYNNYRTLYDRLHWESLTLTPYVSGASLELVLYGKASGLYYQPGESNGVRITFGYYFAS